MRVPNRVRPGTGMIVRKVVLATTGKKTFRTECKGQASLKEVAEENTGGYY